MYRAVQFAISDLGFEMQDLSNFEISYSGFLQSLHGIDDQPFGGLDLFHDEANIHRGVLGLALASAIETVLPDEGKCIRQDVQRGGKSTADRSHLELIPLFGFTIVIEQSQSPSVDIR